MNSAIPLSAGASRKTLLVTLADRAYIAQAKQLFSSAYWKAGWRGDYMLLAHEVPESELGWFRERGILVKQCVPLSDLRTLAGVYPLSVLNKFYLFTPEFKKWDNVLFLDPDIIVRYSLNALAHVQGLYAQRDSTFLGVLHNQFDLKNLQNPQNSVAQEMRQKLVQKFDDNFRRNAPALNTGVIAFSTDIVSERTFADMMDMARTYEGICLYAEQSILSLFFYKKWKRLDFFYNIYMPVLVGRYRIPPALIDGPVLHFCGVDKPWNPSSFFYGEWKANFDRADAMDVASRRGADSQTALSLALSATYAAFPRSKMLLLAAYFFIMKSIWETYYFLDRQIGCCGIFFRKMFK